MFYDTRIISCICMYVIYIYIYLHFNSSVLYICLYIFMSLAVVPQAFISLMNPLLENCNFFYLFLLGSRLGLISSLALLQFVQCNCSRALKQFLLSLLLILCAYFLLYFIFDDIYGNWQQQQPGPHAIGLIVAIIRV